MPFGLGCQKKFLHTGCSIPLTFTIYHLFNLPHHENATAWCCEIESRTRRGVLDITLSDKFCQWLAASRWVSLGTPVSSTNKTNRHEIIEILLKVVLNTITLTLLDVKLCQILHTNIFFNCKGHVVEEILNVTSPRWTTAKVGIKHQLINQSNIQLIFCHLYSELLCMTHIK